LQARRLFLRWLVFSGIGAGILLFASSAGFSLVKVKVVYNLMARYFDTDEEYFVLQSPALLRSLLNDVRQKHPIMSSMIGDHPTMLILVNGVPSQPTVTLKDGDQVDFIPLFDGG
jgi:molybdopterin converting factor small subunit